MALATALTTLLGVRHPVVLAPMGNVAGGRLAAAVSAAGGLGLIGAGYGDGEWIEREFAAAGNQRVGIGFITWSLAGKPQLLDAALAHRPAAVMLSFGEVAPFAGKIKDAGALLICQVQDVAGARAAARAGADAIVAQGTEAGGHGAARGGFALVPAVADAVAPLPVIAAGAIADGRGLAAALILGAAGALIGTRFFASDEALGPAGAKARIVAAGGDDTVRTRVFDIVRRIDWPAPYTGRALRNDFLERWHGREGELERAVDAESEAYWAAAARGDVDTAVVFAGEGVDLIDGVAPAGAIVRHLVAEAEAALAATARLVAD